MLINSEWIRKILLIIVAHMGDVVLATPVTRALKQKYPQAEVDILVSPLGKEAANHNPYVNKVIEYTIKNWQCDRILLQNLIHFLQAQKYDLALATNYGTLGPMLAWLSGAPYRVGYSDPDQSKFLTHTVYWHRTWLQHEIEKQLEVLKPLGISTQDTNIDFIIYPEEAASLHNKVKLSYDKPLVLLCPISSHPHKNWTIASWHTLLVELSKLANCYLIGGQKELPEIMSISTPNKTQTQVLAGQLTLGESAALIKEANLLITVDTGPMHIAGALQTPILALFGPTHPQVWGPRGPQDVVLQAPQSCSPCWQKADYCSYPCEKHECMKQIFVSNVLQTAKAMLQLD